MNPLSWLNPARWILYAALCAALAGGYAYWAHHEREAGAAPYIAQLATLNAAITAQKAQAQKTLQAETAKTDATMRQLDLALKTQESNDERNKQETHRMALRLAGLAAHDGGRLRDPAGCGRGSGGTSSASAAATQGGARNRPDADGLLSVQLSQLLLSLTASADAINDAYQSCRAWAQAASDALK